MSFWVKYQLIMMMMNWIVGFWLLGFVMGRPNVLNWWCLLLGFICAFSALYAGYAEKMKTFSKLVEGLNGQNGNGVKPLGEDYAR